MNEGNLESDDIREEEEGFLTSARFFSYSQKELQRQQKIIEDLEDIVATARRVCRTYC